VTNRTDRAFASSLISNDSDLQLTICPAVAQTVIGGSL
jgi:hypothetical protein